MGSLGVFWERFSGAMSLVSDGLTNERVVMYKDTYQEAMIKTRSLR